MYSSSDVSFEQKVHHFEVLEATIGIEEPLNILDSYAYWHSRITHWDEIRQNNVISSWIIKEMVLCPNVYFYLRFELWAH